MTEKIIFHLGAHRTGTTYTQAFFKENKEILKKEGIFYESFFDVPRLRKTMVKARGKAQRGKMDEFKEQVEPVTQYLKKIVENPNKVSLISYEGVFGSINLALSKGIYPATKIVLEEIKPILGEKDVTYVFCVRNYADFIESTYKYVARGGTKLSFEAYVKKANIREASWIPVIQSLIDVFGKEKIVIWSYEKFAEDPGKVFEWMFEKSGIESSFLQNMELPEQRKNASASALALTLMRRINPIISRYAKLRGRKKKPIAKKVNAFLEETLSVERYGRPELLGKDIKTELRERYMSDLNKIEEMLPDTTLLK